MDGVIGTYAPGAIPGRAQKQKFAFYVKNYNGKCIICEHFNVLYINWGNCWK